MHPALHTFRMLNLPVVDFPQEPATPVESVLRDEHVPAYHALMQNFANKVIRYMTSQGKAPRVLSINPSYLESERPGTDSNGHRWPEYNYINGRITDALGRSKAVAVSLKAAASEFPDIRVLQETV
jgi:hypothetical protein